MKIVIIGAGALGSIYGGYLSRAGFDVTLIGRLPHIQTILKDGLRISGHDEFVAYPKATVDAQSVREAELLLICVRTTDTETALQDIAHLRPEIVVSFQNGLNKDDMLLRFFGPRPVLGATSIMGARTVEPGHVRCTLFAHTWFGERERRVTPHVKAVIGAWKKAGLPVEISDDIQATEWSKLAYLLPVSTLSGLTRLPYHQILQSPDLAYLFIQIVREVNKVARAYAIELRDYPSINLCPLVERPFKEGIRLLASRGRALQQSGQTDISTNMLHDISVGRPTEIEAVAGDLVQLAQDAGIAVPAISFVYRAIRGIDDWSVRN